MPEAKLTSKGRITIPVSVRREMGLRPGSKLDFIPDTDGAWRVAKRKHSIMELSGTIEWPDEPIPIKEMENKAKQLVIKHFVENS